MMYAHDITQVNQNLISSHDTARFLHEAGEDINRLRMATFFQLTMPGAPSIYYGDEIGMTGAHDPDCRRAFPWDEKENWDLTNLELVKQLSRLRKQYPALRTGDWEAVWWGEEAFAFLRAKDNQQILVVISRAAPINDTTISIQTDVPKILFGDAEISGVQNGIKITRQNPWSGSVILL
jgi:glycosidase